MPKETGSKGAVLADMRLVFPKFIAWSLAPDRVHFRPVHVCRPPPLLYYYFRLLTLYSCATLLFIWPSMFPTAMMFYLRLSAAPHTASYSTFTLLYEPTTLPCFARFPAQYLLFAGVCHSTI